MHAASIDIKNRLAELERRLARDEPPDRAWVIGDAIARLTPEIEQLTDADEAGGGRILFGALGETWTVRVSSQLPPVNTVVVDRSAFIHPLLELLDEGAPAGVVLASRTEARLLEWRLGGLTPLRELRAGLVEPAHEHSGPIGSPPARRYRTPTGEQRNAREREDASRFVERVARATSRLAQERGWQRVLVSAGEHLTDPVLRALPEPLRPLATRFLRLLIHLDGAALEETVTARLRTVHADFERRLIRDIRDGAQGARAVALGLSEVVGALNQARVAHLLYDPTIRYRGSVALDGSLYADEETSPTYCPSVELRLTERLVERALETGARVTPVEGATRDGLTDARGIAAVLRWYCMRIMKSRRERSMSADLPARGRADTRTTMCSHARDWHKQLEPPPRPTHRAAREHPFDAPAGRAATMTMRPATGERR